MVSVADFRGQKCPRHKTFIRRPLFRPIAMRKIVLEAGAARLLQRSKIQNIRLAFSA
jgi:hypothetical protein